MQNQIASVLKKHSHIPVVSINDLAEVDTVYSKLKSQGVSCIEITLRSPISWDAIAMFKEKYGDEFDVGVGTVISAEDILKCVEHKVDFLVSPGISSSMVQQLDFCGIPFLPGVATPSDIIRGLNLGWTYFKFFPANLFGGIEALKTYGGVFKQATFCPTGGINGQNADEFLALENVISVGGSWLVK